MRRVDPSSVPTDQTFHRWLKKNVPQPGHLETLAKALGMPNSDAWRDPDYVAPNEPVPDTRPSMWVVPPLKPAVEDPVIAEATDVLDGVEVASEMPAQDVMRMTLDLAPTRLGALHAYVTLRLHRLLQRQK